jgi:protein-L-isoaspartate(D-aspartate) O-methyltransferase
MTTAGESGPDRAAADGADAARARLARALRDSGHTPSPAVQAAFLAVPRHLFVPGLTPAAAYQDEALVIKYGDDGLPVSSSSQPAMMAIMLEQLGLEPGHRVLEIGTGSGYNAAVMAHIVGPTGSVVTVDIDAGLVDRARASLAAAGHESVLAVCADGGYGHPERAPFDRVIVTAGAWDIAPAWLDQLAPGGRLVLPVAVRGIQLSVGLERGSDRPEDEHWPDEHWVATTAFRCSFVRMAGAFADPEPFRALGGGLYAQTADGQLADTGALASALAGPAVDVGTGVLATSRDELADLDLWLALTEPALDRLTIMDTAADRPPAGPLLPLGGLMSHGAGPGPTSVSGLAGVRAATGQPTGPAGGQPGHPGPGGPAVTDPSAFPGEVVLRGYGPGGAALAAHLASRVPDWIGRGRPGAADLLLTVSRAGRELPARPGQIISSRPHVRLAAGWPDGPAS